MNGRDLGLGIGCLGAALKECKDSPQRRRVCRWAKTPRPQAGLYQRWGSVGVGARFGRPGK
jgi:hypothetical protein